MLAVDAYAQAQNMRAYARTAETSLEVLKAVDFTVDSMARECRILRPLHDAGAAFIKALRAIERKATAQSPALDPDGTVTDALEIVADALRRRLTLFIEKRRSIDRDARLGETQRDLLHCAYEEQLSVLSSVTEVLAELVGLIIGYELLREPRNGLTFNSAEALREHVLTQ